MDSSPQSLQQSLADFLLKNGTITSGPVERAFRTVPRHLFLPHVPVEKAYKDEAIAVRQDAEGRWTSSSSQPSMMAIMLEQLALRPEMRVLEIGSGSGFNAALIASIVGPEGAVTTVDIQPDLIEAAQAHLEDAGFPWVRALVADGGYGFPDGAPYDRIILTASSTVITPAWREQLVEGGRLVLPLNLGGPQASVAFERRGAVLVSLSLAECGFMPMQGALTGPQQLFIQLDQRPGLMLTGLQPLGPDPAVVLTWLETPSPVWSSGIQVATGEVFSGLMPWLTITQPGVFQLVAEGEQVDNANLPQLIYVQMSPEHRTRFTGLLADDSGAAVLTRPPGQAAPVQDWSDPAPGPPEPPFELHVRLLGPAAEGAANRLIERARAWHQAGRPGMKRMQLRAVPADQPDNRLEGEFLLERPWTKFIIWFE